MHLWFQKHSEFLEQVSGSLGFFGGRTSRDGSEGSIAAVGFSLESVLNSAVVRRRKMDMAATGDGYLDC